MVLKPGDIIRIDEIDCGFYGDCGGGRNIGCKVGKEVMLIQRDNRTQLSFTAVRDILPKKIPKGWLIGTKKVSVLDTCNSNSIIRYTYIRNVNDTRTFEF
jgi:hypothetical protein